MVKCIITETKSNLFIVLLDKTGKLLLQDACGKQKNMLGRKRRTQYAAELAGSAVGTKASVLRYKRMSLEIKGLLTKRAKAVITGLRQVGIVIKSIRILPLIAHNGMKHKRARRL